MRDRHQASTDFAHSHTGAAKREILDRTDAATNPSRFEMNKHEFQYVGMNIE